MLLSRIKPHPAPLNEQVQCFKGFKLSGVFSQDLEKNHLHIFRTILHTDLNRKNFAPKFANIQLIFGTIFGAFPLVFSGNLFGLQRSDDFFFEKFLVPIADFFLKN